MGCTFCMHGGVWMQDCKPLWLSGRNGTRFDFVGVAAIAKGVVAADASLVPPDAVGSGPLELWDLHCQID